MSVGSTAEQSVVFVRFLLDADASPGLLPRLLQPYAKRDLVPDRMWSYRGRGGPLMPYGDVLQRKKEQEMRLEEWIRERAYFLWQEAGCPDHQAEGFWQRACEIQRASMD